MNRYEQQDDGGIPPANVKIEKTSFMAGSSYETWNLAYEGTGQTFGLTGYIGREPLSLFGFALFGFGFFGSFLARSAPARFTHFLILSQLLLSLSFSNFLGDSLFIGA